MKQRSCRNEIFDQPGTLMAKTLKLLDGQDLMIICAETKISFYWLKKFAAGTYKNPSVNRIQFLYEHLTSSNLI